MAKLELPKLTSRVRFPSPAPIEMPPLRRHFYWSDMTEIEPET